MKSMIFLFYDFEIGGAQNALVNICNSFSTRNIKCYAICLNNNGPLLDNINKDVDVICLNQKRIMYSVFKLIILVREIKPTALISTLYGLGKLLVILKLFFGQKVITCYREATNPNKDLKRNSIWNKLIYYFNDVIICNSQCVINEIIKNNHISINKIFLLRNSISSAQVLNSKNNNDFKRFLFVGRIDRVKRIELQLMALSKLDPTKYFFNIYGKIVDKKYYEELLKLVVKLNIKNNVNFIFGVIDKSIIYKDSDFLFMTSKYEGFPTVLLEAITYNVYPISFNIKCGPSEIIKSNLVGKLISEPKKNKDDLLFKTINKCWNFKVDNLEAQKILSQFDIDNNINLFLDFLNDKAS